MLYTIRCKNSFIKARNFNFSGLIHVYVTKIKQVTRDSCFWGGQFHTAIVLVFTLYCPHKNKRRHTSERPRPEDRITYWNKSVDAAAQTVSNSRQLYDTVAFSNSTIKCRAIYKGQKYKELEVNSIFTRITTLTCCAVQAGTTWHRHSKSLYL
jgi:hypothetical protein